MDSNFQVAHQQGVVQEGPNQSYALWRVGNLVTRDNEPITIFCTKNRKTGKQPYYLTRVFNTKRFDIVVDGKRQTVMAPEPPRYDIPAYHSDYALTYRFDHYLKDNKKEQNRRSQL